MRSQRARRRAGPQFSRRTCWSARIPPKPPRFRRRRVCGARVRVSECVCGGGHDRHCAGGWSPGVRVGPAPPRPQGTTAPRATARGGEGSARHAVHFLFEARRHPPPRAASLRPGQARPFSESRAPERRRRGDGAGARASAPRGAPARSPARRQQPSSPPLRGPIAQSLRVCTSSSPPPLPSLAQKGGRTSLQAAGWFILRPRLTLIYIASRSRQIFRSGSGNRRAASQCLTAPACPITSGNRGVAGSREGGKCCLALPKEENFVTRREPAATRSPSQDGLGLRFCLGRSRRKKRTREPGGPADRHPRRARGPCPTSLPRKSPRGVFRREGTVNSARGRRRGPGTGKERTEFQERVTRN